MKTIEEQLNSDIYSVQELLLAEAKQILQKQYSEDEISTLEELAKIGFNRSKEWRDYEDWKRAKMVTHYSENYPMNKFITEGAVKKICKKYNLILADVEDYKSDIPFENQKAIVNFRVNKKDIMGGIFSSYPTFNDFMMRFPKPIIKYGHSGLEMEYVSYDEGLTQSKPNEGKVFEKAKNLKVIAPPSKLNMKGKKIKGHCLIDKDPIVLQPVKDGYLIVTAWGFEAKDPEVQNPRHN